MFFFVVVVKVGLLYQFQVIQIQKRELLFIGA